ncbi:MAG: GNAT family N-acetyltransferase [Chitinophagaceae bacterium]
MNRLAKPEDFSFIYHLYMHPENNRWLLYDQMDEPSFQSIFDELVKRGHLYIYEADGLPAGMFKLQPMRYRNRHIIYLGGVAVAPECKGKGHGSKIITESVSIAHQLGFKRIELTVATENEKAIHLYERHGFQKEGVLKNYSYLKDEDVYLDEWVMGLMIGG